MIRPSRWVLIGFEHNSSSNVANGVKLLSNSSCRKIRITIAASILRWKAAIKRSKSNGTSEGSNYSRHASV
jgi:hypothetical protein